VVIEALKVVKFVKFVSKGGVRIFVQKGRVSRIRPPGGLVLHCCSQLLSVPQLSLVSIDYRRV
jgi:hypothetical protein